MPHAYSGNGHHYWGRGCKRPGGLLLDLLPGPVPLLQVSSLSAAGEHARQHRHQINPSGNSGGDTPFSPLLPSWGDLQPVEVVLMGILIRLSSELNGELNEPGIHAPMPTSVRWRDRRPLVKDPLSPHYGARCGKYIQPASQPCSMRLG